MNKQLLLLNQSNLESIQSGVLKPNYIRSNLSAGIVHIGVGNFHRAHLSWYLHRLMQKNLAKYERESSTSRFSYNINRARS